MLLDCLYNYYISGSYIAWNRTGLFYGLGYWDKWICSKVLLLDLPWSLDQLCQWLITCLALIVCSLYKYISYNFYLVIACDSLFNYTRNHYLIGQGPGIQRQWHSLSLSLCLLCPWLLDQFYQLIFIGLVLFNYTSRALFDQDIWRWNQVCSQLVLILFLAIIAVLFIAVTIDHFISDFDYLFWHWILEAC